MSDTPTIKLEKYLNLAREIFELEEKTKRKKFELLHLFGMEGNSDSETSSRETTQAVVAALSPRRVGKKRKSRSIAELQIAARSYFRVHGKAGEVELSDALGAGTIKTRKVIHLLHKEKFIRFTSSYPIVMANQRKVTVTKWVLVKKKAS